ncbi:MAG: hypothetical protein U9Q19_13620, partial [Pseudomonadota bacterium]|nr:hypothetical protein [Pseudomonadota bacterium]
VFFILFLSFFGFLIYIIIILKSYTQNKFKRFITYEEQLMSQFKYPEYAEHKADHAKLMQHITDLAEQFRSGDLLLSFAVMVDLKAWATIHIEIFDGPLGIFLGEKGSQAR